MSQTDAIALVRAHGRSSSSFQSLAANLRHWFDPSREACVAYNDVGDAWVAVGNGLAPREHQPAVMDAFAREGRARGKRVRFFASEGELPSASSFSALQVGELPVWDPRDWPNSLSTRMRAQLRRDAKHGHVTVRLASQEEIADARSATRRGIADVVAHWLDTRRLAPMGFMVDVDPWHLAHERRFFVAERKGRVVATLIAIPVYARNGWFLETMLRMPDAPNGTVELLFDLAMRTSAAEGSSYLTFGMCVLSGATSPLLKLIRRFTGAFYNFEGLHKFKSKLCPTAWEPVYLVYPKGDLAISALWDAANAFMPGGPAVFAWNSAIQRARDTTRWMAYLGIAWITIFAWLAQADWFSSPTAKLTRVALDMLTVGGLWWLGKGIRRRLALGLSALALSTFTINCLQLAEGGAAHAQGFLESTVVGIGTIGPLVTALFLFACRDREHRYVVDKDPPASGPIARPWVLNRNATGDGEL